MSPCSYSPSTKSSKTVPCSPAIFPGENYNSAAYCRAPLIHTISLPHVDNNYTESILAASAYESKANLPIYFDLRRHPSHIRLGNTGRSTYTPVPTKALLQPATTPKAEKITIRCLDLPWEIRLKSGYAYLTAEEVIDGIYEFLQKPIRKDEWESICRGQPDVARRCQETFVHRCMTSRHRQQEEAHGRRRVDLLASPLFAGLQIGPDGTVWMNTMPA
ncbi:hypothetical protein BC629DRAFT_1444581 [Irpex lacteus]|nr:hypothetical protein BC629DRAFT_1444581 [Irpex lacteus]